MGGLDSINIVIKSPLFYITLVFDQQVYCFSLSTYLTSLQFSLSMNYHLHCFSINMVFNQHCFRSTLLIICIKFSQHIKTSQLLFNLWLNFNLNCFSITCIIFSLYCFSISTDFRSTLVDLDFNLNCFSITCIIFNLYCFSITCIIFNLYCFSISTVFRSILVKLGIPTYILKLLEFIVFQSDFQSHAWLSVSIDVQSQLFFNQYFCKYR